MGNRIYCLKVILILYFLRVSHVTLKHGEGTCETFCQSPNVFKIYNIIEKEIHKYVHI